MKFIYAFWISIIIIITPALSQEWKHFGDLNESRSNFQALPLSDHEIIIIGGETPTKVLNSCEIINLNTGLITYTSPLNVARSQFSAILTKDSNIIVVGGFTNTIEKYDKKTMTWKLIGEMQELRLQHSLVQLDPDRILIVGGRDGTIFPIASVEIFNMTTNTSELIEKFPSRFSSGVLLKNSQNNIWCFGGRAGGANSNRLSDIYQFDDKTYQWNKIAKLIDSVQNITATKLANGSIFACNGSISEKPVRHSNQVFFEKAGKLVFGKTITARQWHLCEQLSENEVLIAGGFNDSLVALNSTEIYNIQTNSSKFFKQTLTPHVSGAMVEIDDKEQSSKRFVLISGYSDVFKTLQSNVEILTISK